MAYAVPAPALNPFTTPSLMSCQRKQHIDEAPSITFVREYGAATLLEATASGHSDMVKELAAAIRYLDNTNDEEQEDERGAEVCGGKHIDVLRLLFDKCVSLNLNNSFFGFTPLSRAAMKGHVDIVKTLLQCGADVQTRGNRGLTALMMAAKEGHSDCLIELIGSGADINLQDDSGNTALIYACGGSHSSSVRILLEMGHAEVDFRDKAGFTALLVAAQQGSADIVGLLIASGADVNAVEPRTGLTALHLAAAHRHAECILALLAAGADAAAQIKPYDDLRTQIIFGERYGYKQLPIHLLLFTTGNINPDYLRGSSRKSDEDFFACTLSRTCSTDRVAMLGIRGGGRAGRPIYDTSSGGGGGGDGNHYQVDVVGIKCVRELIRRYPAGACQADSRGKTCYSSLAGRSGISSAVKRLVLLASPPATDPLQLKHVTYEARRGAMYLLFAACEDERDLFFVTGSTSNTDSASIPPSQYKVLSLNSPRSPPGGMPSTVIWEKLRAADNTLRRQVVQFL